MRSRDCSIGVQVSASEGSASKTDFGAFGSVFGGSAAAGLGGYALCAAGHGGEPLLLGTIVFEHFAGGMATAALFTVAGLTSAIGIRNEQCDFDRLSPESAAGCHDRATPPPAYARR